MLNEYQLELKIQRAKQMLNDTPASIKEVAAALGYSSAEHFFNMFKKATGQTPGEYRLYGWKIDQCETSMSQR